MQLCSIFLSVRITLVCLAAATQTNVICVAVLLHTRDGQALSYFKPKETKLYILSKLKKVIRIQKLQ